MPLTISWSPLSPGEKPGDPELGGWRPFRPSLVKQRGSHVASDTLTLATCIKWLAEIVTKGNIRFALNYVAHKLTPN